MPSPVTRPARTGVAKRTVPYHRNGTNEPEPGAAPRMYERSAERHERTRAGAGVHETNPSLVPCRGLTSDLPKRTNEPEPDPAATARNEPEPPQRLGFTIGLPPSTNEPTAPRAQPATRAGMAPSARRDEPEPRGRKARRARSNPRPAGTATSPGAMPWRIACTREPDGWRPPRCFTPRRHPP